MARDSAPLRCFCGLVLHGEQRSLRRPATGEFRSLFQMFLILLLALLGLFLRGFPGMVWGAAIGFVVQSLVRSFVRTALRAAKTQFFDSTFAVMGALCKADGVVSRNEIRAAEDLFAKLRLSATQKEQAKEAFTRGKADDFDLDAEVDKFARAARRSSMLYQMFLQVQLTAITADGEVHAAERDMLVRIAHRMGLAERDIAQLEALLRSVARGPSEAASGPPPRDRLDDAYAALGVEEGADESAVKRAYRKLIIENHPDKLASKGLPENMRILAEQRTRDINNAYDVVRRARGFQ